MPQQHKFIFSSKFQKISFFGDFFCEMIGRLGLGLGTQDLKFHKKKHFDNSVDFSKRTKS